MAVLGKWTGGTIGSLALTTTWAAPNGLFPTQSRNDSSTYTFTSSTSTLTLPSSGLADGYLIIAGFEHEDSSNGRFNPQGRIIQASGTGNFVGNPTGGYARDTSEDRSFVNCWAFVDGPSTSSTYQFQWRRDTDDAGATDGTVNSYFHVIPFFYSDIGMYTGADASLLGGTTRTVMALNTNVVQGTNITRSGNIVTVTGDNKRYFILSGAYFDSLGGGSRTQRIFGHDYDGSADLAAQSYGYYRNAANDQLGNIIHDIIETVTASRTIELTCFRGIGVAAGEGGGDVDGTAATSGNQAIVVIELNDSAEVFRSNDGTGEQTLPGAGPIDLTISRTTDIDFNDSASWVRASDTAINAEVAMDALLGSNIWAAQETVTTTTRWTARSHITVNGTEDATTMHGNYQRNDQTTQDTFGWSANPIGFIALSLNDDVGVSVQEITGTEGGAGTASQAGTVGFWGINLDTLVSTGETIDATKQDITYTAQTNTLIDQVNATLQSINYAAQTNTLVDQINATLQNVTYTPHNTTIDDNVTAVNSSVTYSPQASTLIDQVVATKQDVTYAPQDTILIDQVVATKQDVAYTPQNALVNEIIIATKADVTYTAQQAFTDTIIVADTITVTYTPQNTIIDDLVTAIKTDITYTPQNAVTAELVNALTVNVTYTPQVSTLIEEIQAATGNVTYTPQISNATDSVNALSTSVSYTAQDSVLIDEINATSSIVAYTPLNATIDDTITAIKADITYTPFDADADTNKVLADAVSLIYTGQTASIDDIVNAVDTTAQYEYFPQDARVKIVVAVGRGFGYAGAVGDGDYDDVGIDKIPIKESSTYFTMSEYEGGISLSGEAKWEIVDGLTKDIPLDENNYGFRIRDERLERELILRENNRREVLNKFYGDKDEKLHKNVRNKKQLIEHLYSKNKDKITENPVSRKQALNSIYGKPREYTTISPKSRQQMLAEMYGRKGINLYMNFKNRNRPKK